MYVQLAAWAPSQYPKRRLSVRSRKVSKPRDLYLELSDRSEICLSNFKAIRQFKVPISWLRDFTRSYGKTSFRILRRGPGSSYHCISHSFCYIGLGLITLAPSIRHIKLAYARKTAICAEPGLVQSIVPFVSGVRKNGIGDGSSKRQVGLVRRVGEQSRGEQGWFVMIFMA